jgi:hypothetical protein
MSRTAATPKRKRDRRFVAVHRGGPLDLARHRALAQWAADCAEHVLPLFTKVSGDDRPRRAIETARAWASGQVRVGAAQKAAVASHVAAREMTDPSAIAAARATAHAAATAHMADHSLGPALYGVKAVEADGGSARRERAWQLARLPASINQLVVSALQQIGSKSAPSHSSFEERRLGRPRVK